MTRNGESRSVLETVTLGILETVDSRLCLIVYLTAPQPITSRAGLARQQLSQDLSLLPQCVDRQQQAGLLGLPSSVLAQSTVNKPGYHKHYQQSKKRGTAHRSQHLPSYLSFTSFLFFGSHRSVLLHVVAPPSWVTTDQRTGRRLALRNNSAELGVGQPERQCQAGVPWPCTRDKRSGSKFDRGKATNKPAASLYTKTTDLPRPIDAI